MRKDITGLHISAAAPTPSAPSLMHLFGCVAVAVAALAVLFRVLFFGCCAGSLPWSFPSSPLRFGVCLFSVPSAPLTPHVRVCLFTDVAILSRFLGVCVCSLVFFLHLCGGVWGGRSLSRSEGTDETRARAQLENIPW